MGGVADAVSNVVSDIGGAVGDVVNTVGTIAEDTVHVVEQAANTVGHALESVGKTVVNDPIGTLAKVGAVVTQQYWALPLISAADVVAHGGNLEQAAIAGGVSYIGGNIAAGVSDALATSADSTLQGVQTTADGSTVYTYSDGSTMTQTAAGETSYTDPTGLSQGTANALGGAAANAAKTLVQTGDITKAITSGAISGAGGYLGSEASGALQGEGVGTGTANVTGGIAGSTAAGILAGKTGSDALAGAISGSIMKTVMGQASSTLKSAWNDANNTVSEYNTQLDSAKQFLSNELTPAQQDATAAQTAAKTSYDNYNNLNSQFNDLVSKYNDAKNSGDTASANTYADQANALIPQLNAATDQYNKDAGTYQTALDKFNNLNSQFTDTTSKLSDLKNTYSEQNAALTQQSAELQAAAQKVAGMSTEAQTAFTNATGTGADIATALDTTTKVNSMNDAAQATFNRQFAQNGSLTDSLNQASTVNSLDSNQLSAYTQAVKNNLNYDQSLTVASNAANFNAAGQDAYAQALKAGNSAQDASELALLTQATAPDTPSITGSDVVSALTGSSTANAAETPAPASTVEGTYHQDPSTGMWSVVGTGPDGKQVTLVPLAQGAGAPLVEGASAGQYSLGADNTAVPVSSTPTLVSETTDPATGNVTQKLSDGTTKVLDANGDPVATTSPSQTEAQPGATGTETQPPATASDSSSGTGGTSIAAALTNTTGLPVGGTPSSTGTAPVKAPLVWSPSLGKWIPAGSAATAAAAAAPVASTATTATAPATTAPVTTPAPVASTDIKDLTPGLTKGSEFKFANEPTFTPQLTQMPQQAINPDYATEIMSAATGGSTNNANTTSSSTITDLTPTLTQAGNKFKFASSPTFTPGTFTPVMTGALPSSQNILAAATGGQVPGYAEGQSVQMPDAPSPYLRPTLTHGRGLQPFSHFGGAQFPGYQPQRFAAGGSPDIPEGHDPQFFSEGGLNSLENKFVTGDGDGTSDSVAAMLAKGEFVIPADVVSDLGNGSNDAGAEVLDEFLKTIREHKRAADAKNLPPDSKGALAYLLDAKRKVG